MNGNNGNRGAGGALADKAKFTVFVRGHQWSSARQVHETLQEFARVIEKNARRLGFISQDDKVERLQLARSTDGTDPEELDVDATLEDVLICMGKKQLVALITPANNQAETRAAGHTHKPDMLSEDNPATTMPTNTDAPTVLNTENVTLLDNIPPSNKYSLATPTSAPSSREELNQNAKHMRVCAPESPITSTQSKKSEPPPCPQLFSRVTYSPTTSTELPPHEGPFKRPMYAKGLSISIPDSDMNQFGSPTDLVGINYQATALASNSCHQNILLSNMAQPTNLTGPSSTELAQLLVKTSSIHPPQYLNPAFSASSTCVGNNPFLHNPSRLFNEMLPHPQTLPPAHTIQSYDSLAPTGWINNCAEPIHPIHPMIASANSLKLPTPNIAVLAQFLASQLRAFMPTESKQHTSVPPTINDERLHSSNTQSALHGNLEHTLQHGPETASLTSDVSLANANQTNDGSPCSHLDPAHCTIESRPEKDQSSSSAIDVQQNAQSQQEMIFLVNRRSKTGTGTHRLKMSELSTYFHLSVVDAAKKLGVSQTTLKKACRKFGLKRWPGRKVRSLESTIHGLEHTIAVGQGAGMEELTEAQIRSEVMKLQQEMDHLVHGFPSMQHPTALRTADLYKRLYSRGWRSKHHSSESSNCMQIDSNAGAVAAATNNYATSTLTSCNLDRCNVQTDTTEALSNPHTLTPYSKLESNHDSETIKSDNNERDSPVIDEARNSNCGTNYHWAISTIKSTRSKRKRRFWDVADKQDIRNDIHKHGWRDNPAHLDAENFNRVIHDQKQNKEHEPITDDELVHKVPTKHHTSCDKNHLCLQTCRLANSLNKDLRTHAS